MTLRACETICMGKTFLAHSASEEKFVGTKEEFSLDSSFFPLFGAALEHILFF